MIEIVLASPIRSTAIVKFTAARKAIVPKEPRHHAIAFNFRRSKPHIMRKFHTSTSSVLQLTKS
jgi:hypothetical protein